MKLLVEEAVDAGDAIASTPIPEVVDTVEPVVENPEAEIGVIQETPEAEIVDSGDVIANPETPEVVAPETPEAEVVVIPETPETEIVDNGDAIANTPTPEVPEAEVIEETFEAAEPLPEPDLLVETPEAETVVIPETPVAETVDDGNAIANSPIPEAEIVDGAFDTVEPIVEEVPLVENPESEVVVIPETPEAEIVDNGDAIANAPTPEIPEAIETPEAETVVVPETPVEELVGGGNAIANPETPEVEEEVVADAFEAEEPQPETNLLLGTPEAETVVIPETPVAETVDDGNAIANPETPEIPEAEVIEETLEAAEPLPEPNLLETPEAETVVVPETPVKEPIDGGDAIVDSPATSQDVEPIEEEVANAFEAQEPQPEASLVEETSQNEEQVPAETPQEVSEPENVGNNPLESEQPEANQDDAANNSNSEEANILVETETSEEGENSESTSAIAITEDQSDPDTFNITGGTPFTDETLEGESLFFEFDRFNVGEGQTANFVSSPEISNIIASVTEEDDSDINGNISFFNIDDAGNTVEPENSPNFFLVNSAGINFGETADINLPASFTVSTGDSFDNVNNPLGDINNAGEITVTEDAGLNFIGDTVINTGSITSNFIKISANDGALSGVVEIGDEGSLEVVNPTIIEVVNADDAKDKALNPGEVFSISEDLLEDSNVDLEASKRITFNTTSTNNGNEVPGTISYRKLTVDVVPQNDDTGTIEVFSNLKNSRFDSKQFSELNLRNSNGDIVIGKPGSPVEISGGVGSTDDFNDSADINIEAKEGNVELFGGIGIRQIIGDDDKFKPVNDQSNIKIDAQGFTATEPFVFKPVTQDDGLDDSRISQDANLFVYRQFSDRDDGDEVPAPPSINFLVRFLNEELDIDQTLPNLNEQDTDADFNFQITLRQDTQFVVEPDNLNVLSDTNVSGIADETLLIDDILMNGSQLVGTSLDNQSFEITPPETPTVTPPVVVTPPETPIVTPPVVTPSETPIVTPPVVTPPETPTVTPPVVTPPETPTVTPPVVTPPETPTVTPPVVTPPETPTVTPPVVVTPPETPTVTPPVVTPPETPTVTQSSSDTTRNSYRDSSR